MLTSLMCIYLEFAMNFLDKINQPITPLEWINIPPVVFNATKKSLR